TATINGAPASSPEGTAINLTSSVSDPGTLDTQSYAWTVTKNGNPYASGSLANFSFTPNDNGTYVVSLTVTDNDGGIGSDTKTVNDTTDAPTPATAGAPASSPKATTISIAAASTDPPTLDTVGYAWSVTKNDNPHASGTGTGFNFTPNDNA